MTRILTKIEVPRALKRHFCHLNSPICKICKTTGDISNGRFWLNIGAGWFRREYEAYGLPFCDHDERVARARETIKVIKRLWEENSVTFHGEHYSISNGILEPKPNPRPPVWYAGMSEASRNLVAEEADGWLMGNCSLEEAQKNIADMYARLSKERNKIEFAVPAWTFIRDADEEAKEYVERITGGNKDVLDRTLDTGLIGSPETVAQRIKQLERIGIYQTHTKISSLPKSVKWGMLWFKTLR